MHNLHGRTIAISPYFFCRTICSKIGTYSYSNSGVYVLRIVVYMTYFTTVEMFILKRFSVAKVKSTIIL
jgi:hypothetical protein